MPTAGCVKSRQEPFDKAQGERKILIRLPIVASAARYPAAAAYAKADATAKSRQSYMSSEIWALLSAAAWAVDSILVRKGTAYSNASTAAFVSFLVSVSVLVPYIFLQFPAEKIFHPANLYFVASGVIQPAIVRVLF